MPPQVSDPSSRPISDSPHLPLLTTILHDISVQGLSEVMKMMVKKLLGDLVKEERLRRNLSQNALAENVHVPYAQYLILRTIMLF